VDTFALALSTSTWHLATTQHQEFFKDLLPVVILCHSFKFFLFFDSDQQVCLRSFIVVLYVRWTLLFFFPHMSDRTSLYMLGGVVVSPLIGCSFIFVCHVRSSCAWTLSLSAHTSSDLSVYAGGSCSSMSPLIDRSLHVNKKNVNIVRYPFPVSRSRGTNKQGTTS